MKKRILSLVVVMTMLLSFMPVIARAATSGECGDNLTWTLDDNGTLTISGTGDMTNWSYPSGPPWYSSCDSIKNVIIGNGVKSIGVWAFLWCSSLESVTIGNSVESIGYGAFFDCSSLESVTIPDSVTIIDIYAFYDCSSLTSVVIPNSVTSIRYYAFDGCNSLTDVYYGGSENEWKAISINNGNSSLTHANIHYNSSGNINADTGDSYYLNEITPIINERYTGNEGDSFIHSMFKKDHPNIPYGNGNIGIDGTVYEHGLEAWIARWNYTEEISWAYAVYQIDNNYKSLTGDVVLLKSYNTTNFDSTLYFYDYDKDILLCEYRLTPETISFPVSVNIEGVNKLKILIKDNIAVCGGTSFGLANFQVKKSAYSPILPPGELNMPSDINNVTINHKGTAYGYFSVTNVDGAALKNKSVSYTIDGGAAKTVVTDDYGYLCVQIPNITQSHDYAVSISGSGVVPSTGTLSVTVKPLYFTSTYEGTMTKGVSVGVGIGVGGSIGNLKAEAEAAEIGASGSNKKGFSWSQECKDGKTKLTVTANQNSEAAVKAKVGLWAGASASNAHAEVSVGDIHGSAKYGAISSVGFEDEDFDANDKADVTRLAKFMTCAFLENMDSNVATQYLLEKLNFTPDTYEDGSTVAVSGGASVGSVTLKNGDTEFASVTLGGIDGNAVWSQSVKTAKDKSVNRKSSVSADAGVKLGDVSFFKKDGSDKLSTGVSTFTKSFINNKIQFAATNDKDGNLTSLGIVLTDNDSSSILWSRKTTSTQRSLTYSDDAAKQVASSYNELQNFSNGNKGFFTPFQMIKATDAIMKSNKKGEFSENITKSQGLDLNASASAKMFLKLGGQLGVSGAESYSYETENGIYENNVAYIQAKNDVESTVEDDFIKISDAFDISSKYMDDMIAEWWDTISGWIDDAADAVIDAGKAALEKTKDVVTGWKVSITKAVEDISPFSVLAVDSEVSLFSTSSVATTVGSPYIVSVEDENGNEVTDLSSNPLLLTLEYTDDELAGAGVTDINDVAIYRWDEDKCVYVRMGGTLNEANKSLSLEITKPGQYILAADNCPPAVTEFKVSDSGSNPDITAIVSDMSGIADFEMTIDGETVIDNSNFEDYYDHTTAQFIYPTNGLAAGSHTAVIYASDTSGNALADGVDIEFTINTDAPVISNVTGFSEQIQNGAEISAEITGESISAVYLNIEETNENGRTSRSTYEMTEENGIYTAYADGITEGATLNVWISAYSTDGNSTQSEKQTVLSVPDYPALVFTDIKNDSVTITAANCNDITDGTIILAIYNENSGTLRSVLTKDYEQTVVFDNLDLIGCTVKVMLWDSLNDMKPLCATDEN